MNIDYKSPKAIAKAVVVFLALTAASAAALTGIAMAVDLAVPGKGWGGALKGWFRIGA